MAEEARHLARYIRDVPDWPKRGILFRDITPLLGNPEAFPAAVEALCRPFRDAGIQYVAGVEARGFIFGAAVATHLRAGFVPIRKKGKLPWQTESASYDLEYGTDSIEMHRDAIPPGAKVLLVDDLLATGGTLQAACRLMEKVGADVVGIAVVIELTELNGRQRLAGHRIHALVPY
jgi:adenine phosphoribosyltransferase